MLKPLHRYPVIVVFAAAQQPTTVVEIFRENDSFSTLLQAIDAAGLSEALAGDGPFTLSLPPTTPSLLSLKANSTASDPVVLTEVLE